MGVRVRLRVRLQVRVRVAVAHGCVVHAEALDGRVEQVEALLGDGGGDGGADATRLCALVKDGHLVEVRGRGRGRVRVRVRVGVRVRG